MERRLVTDFVPSMFVDLNTSLQPIINTFQILDPFKVYRELESDLTIGSDGRNDRGILLAALDRAEVNTRLAHKMFMSSKIEYDRYMAQLDVKKSDMLSQAKQELEAEKKTLEFKKQITNDDVISRCAEKFPEQWVYLNKRVAEMKAAVSDLEDLVFTWKSRCETLRTMVRALPKPV